MTNDAVPVTAEAREAAADLLALDLGEPLSPADKFQLECIRSGDGDDDNGVQAFARFERDILARHRGSTAVVDVELRRFAQNIFNGLDTRMIVIDSPADETLANVLRQGRKALASLSQTPATPMDELQRLGQEYDGPVQERLREALPKRCDGIEQPAFEEWAKDQGFDMTEHPLHYLFLNAKTDAARQAWCAGIKHASDRIAALADRTQEGEVQP